MQRPKTIYKTDILQKLDLYLHKKVQDLKSEEEISEFRLYCFAQGRPIPEEAYYLVDPIYRKPERIVEGFLVELNNLKEREYGTYYSLLTEYTKVYEDGKLVTKFDSSHLTSGQLKRMAFMTLIEEFFASHPEYLENKQ